MLMRPIKTETAVHGCQCPGDMAVRMRKVLGRSWVGVRVCHLLLLIVASAGYVSHHKYGLSDLLFLANGLYDKHFKYFDKRPRKS